MFKLIEGLPSGVLGVEASGKVTHEDYARVLVPKAEAMIKHGPLRLLYVIGPDFEAYELGAIWDDSVFGIRHWRDFERVGFVGDQAWLRAAVGFFSPFMPCEVRLFPLAELEAAKAWIGESKSTK
jgi:SpoIIAA-like